MALPFKLDKTHLFMISNELLHESNKNKSMQQARVRVCVCTCAQRAAGCNYKLDLVHYYGAQHRDLSLYNVQPNYSKPTERD